MPKRNHSNTEALRREFSAELAAAIGTGSKKQAADKLGVTRQMLRLYLKGKATPGGEVIKKACDEWNLSLSIKGFRFTGEDFAASGASGEAKAVPVQLELSLAEVLGKLQSNQLEAEVIGREGDSFYLRLRIKLAA